MIPGFNTLLIGASGTGKTHALRTLPDCGITPFIIFTEPGMEVVNDIPCPKLHWMYRPPAVVPWSALRDRALKMNQLSFGALKKVVDSNKSKYVQWISVVDACDQFICDRCKVNFGDVATWGTDRALVVDTLSGLSVMSLQLVVGGKPSPDQGEWGMAMTNIEYFLMTLCNGTNAHFILNAHVEREPDILDGSIRQMCATLGKKLAPKIPYNFSDVVQSLRDGGTFIWRTDAGNVDLKARNLTWAASLPPDYKGIVDGWKSHGGQILSTTVEEHKTQTNVVHS